MAEEPPAPAQLVVLVDDEDDLREPTAAYLRDQGIDVAEADGGAALDALRAERRPTLVVLDVTMPQEDGFSIARRLRGANPDIGIIMLTARRDVIDRVVGLELGADDYLMKPFEPRELLARIRAVLRRREARPGVSAAAVEPPQDEIGTPSPSPPPAGDRAYQTEFWVQTQAGQVCVTVDRIEWIEAAKDYALLHCAERSFMVRMTMTALEEALDPAIMVRVHRSAFVRVGAVRRINAVGRHMVLIMPSGAAVRVGPRHWSDVRARLHR